MSTNDVEIGQGHPDTAPTHPHDDPHTTAMRNAITNHLKDYR